MIAFILTKKYLPDSLLLTIGLLVMGLRIYLIAMSQGWVALGCIPALAVVWVSWYRQLLHMAFKSLGVDPFDEDDLPSVFPG